MSFIDQLTQWVMIISAVSGIGGVFDLIMRLLPTKEPMSIAKYIAVVVHSVARFFEALDGLMDKLVGQNLK